MKRLSAIVIGLCEWIFCLLCVGHFAFVYHLSVFRYFCFYFPSFQLFWDARVVCFSVIENPSLYPSQFRILAYALLHVCFHLSKIKLWKYWLQLHCLLIASFRHSFRCLHRKLFCSHNQHIKTRLVIRAGCTGAGALVRRRLPYTAKRIIVLLQSIISLANI